MIREKLHMLYLQAHAYITRNNPVNIQKNVGMLYLGATYFRVRLIRHDFMRGFTVQTPICKSDLYFDIALLQCEFGSD